MWTVLFQNCNTDSLVFLDAVSTGVPTDLIPCVAISLLVSWFSPLSSHPHLSLCINSYYSEHLITFFVNLALIKQYPAKICGFIPLNDPAGRRDVLDALVHPLLALACLLSTWASEFHASCSLLLWRSWRAQEDLSSAEGHLSGVGNFTVLALQHTLALSPSCLRGCVPNEYFVLKYIF